MITREIVDRVINIDVAARREQLIPSEIIQKTKAVRFPDLGLLIKWVVIVRGLKYADPADEDNPEGYSNYRVRLLTASDPAWDSETTYNTGDNVIYGDNYSYSSKIDENLNRPPTGEPSSNGYWEYQEEITVSGLAMEGSYLSTDLRDWSRWFAKDDIIPLVERNNNWYIWQTLTPCGSEGVCSLRWNETDNRLMSVYK